jgi:DNA-binding CsgD family transcriptional regulator
MFDEVRFRSTREMAARYQQLTGVALDLPPVEAWLLEDYGIVDRYTAPLIADPHNNDIVTIHFTDAELTTRGVSVGNMLLPHLAQAAKLSRPFALLESRFRAVLRVLDRFHLGVFFITAAGDIVIENAAARRILDQKDGVLRKSGQLHFHGNGVQAQFREICQSLLNSRSRDMKRLYVPRQAGHAPLVVECTTLSRVPDGGSTAFNGFLVIATDPEHREIIVLDDLNHIYGLTPAEAAVCEHVVSGYSVEEIAEIRGRSPETIRSQLKAVKRKCGVSNRVELVRRALDVSLPVDSGVKSELG